MILTFTQSSDQSFGGVPAYEAEFEVTSNFAIHIERTRGDAALILKQRTGGGKYALVDDFNYAKSKGEVLDYEASVTIPKYIKIVSEVEPTLAEIVTDGEVTEIKSQAKEIEITNNGTTEVVPDSGFAYLSKVNIKTNVPQNGEGGEGVGSSITYMDMRGIEGPLRMNLLNYSLYIKANIASAGLIVAGMPVNPLTSMGFVNEDTLALAIDFSQEVGMLMDETMQSTTVAQAVLSNGVTQEQIDVIPRITEEEFYNLNA